LRGGSTISNQTAKNVFLWPGRNWTRKGLEAYFTLLIELIWGKQRIMEIYLNVIEFGPGIYGAEAASQRFFKKSAAELTRYQAALLASVLPNPDEWSAANPGPYVRKRASTIMARALDAPDAGAAVCPGR
jgi:monofunctional biosynthetic peptidoglycan transglycosylase